MKLTFREFETRLRCVLALLPPYSVLGLSPPDLSRFSSVELSDIVVYIKVKIVHLSEGMIKLYCFW